MTLVRVKQMETCTMEGCEHIRYIAKLCKSHYADELKKVAGMSIREMEV